METKVIAASPVIYENQDVYASHLKCESKVLVASHISHEIIGEGASHCISEIQKLCALSQGRYENQASIASQCSH